MFPFKNNEDIELLLDSTQFSFDVVVITETIIIKNKFSVNGINLTNYSFEYCPTGSYAGGTQEKRSVA